SAQHAVAATGKASADDRLLVRDAARAAGGRAADAADRGAHRGAFAGAAPESARDGADRRAERRGEPAADGGLARRAHALRIAAALLEVLFELRLVDAPHVHRRAVRARA